MGSLLSCPCSTVPTTVDRSAKLPALDGDGSGLALAAIRFRSLVITKSISLADLRINLNSDLVGTCLVRAVMKILQ